MQYDVDTAEQYLVQLTSDWRKDKLLALRQELYNLAPEIEECINYKMLCYRLSKHVVCHLNVQKNTVSLYVGDISKVDPSGELLRNYNVGKGCVRLTKTKSIESANFKQFLSEMIKLARQGVDLSC